MSLANQTVLVAGGAGDVGEGIARQWRGGRNGCCAIAQPGAAGYAAKQADISSVEGAEALHTLLLATPVKTRSRGQASPEWISSDDAGKYCVSLAQSATDGETVIFDNSQQLP